MARRKRQEEKASLGYMLTYGDLVTLVLCFFVAIVSMSTMEKAKIRVMLSSFRGAFGIVEMGPSITEEDMMTMGMEVVKLPQGIPTVITGRQAERGMRERSTMDKIQQALVEERKKGAVQLRYDERGIIVQLTDKALFDSGKADIRLTSRPLLDRVAELIAALPNQIRVEGHTDNIPVKGVSSNWELSVARATNVLRYLEEVHRLSGGRLSAAGYGEYRPIDSNATPEGRARNRRVDVVILREEAREEPKTMN